MECCMSYSAIVPWFHFSDLSYGHGKGLYDYYIELMPGSWEELEDELDECDNQQRWRQKTSLWGRHDDWRLGFRLRSYSSFWEVYCTLSWVLGNWLIGYYDCRLARGSHICRSGLFVGPRLSFGSWVDGEDRPCEYWAAYCDSWAWDLDLESYYGQALNFALFRGLLGNSFCALKCFRRRPSS